MNAAPQAPEIMNYSNRDFFKALIELTKTHKWGFWGATFARFLAELVWIYPTYALAKTVDILTKHKPGDSIVEIYWIIGLLIGASVINSVGRFVGRHKGLVVGERVALDAYAKTIAHMFKIDIAWHARLNSGNKLKKMQKGAEGIAHTFQIWFNVAIATLTHVIGVSILMLYFNPLLGTLVMVFLVTQFLIVRWFTAKASNAAYKANVADEEFTGLLFESISNIRSVKVMAMTRVLLERLGFKIESLFQKIKERIFWFQSGNFAKQAWGQVFRMAIFIYIVFGILNGRYEIGLLIIFYNYFSKVWEAISELAEMSQNIVVSKYGLLRMIEVLKEPVLIDDESGKVGLPPDWKKIEVKNLSFSYGDEETLKNISFEIKRGEKIGIVGLSGAGKSTLLKILLKEYENYEGEILIDGIPLRGLSRTDYFKHVAVVLQDTEVFNFTVKDNIVIANYDERENTALLDNVLKISHIDDLVENLPDKLDTLIGEKGIKLSGGEKQRLGIARAVFKQPQILFLDEATSHLDLESEEKIQDSLHKFFEDITAVVIAHRLTTIKDMDRIIVLESGRIVEEGSFSGLQKKKGRFCEFWSKQEL